MTTPERRNSPPAPTLAERITARRAAWAALNSAWDAAHAAQAVYDACYDAWLDAARRKASAATVNAALKQEQTQ